MTLALRLAQKGLKVSLFEAAPEFGGLAASWEIDDFTWDKHYHVTLLSDMRLRNLLKELDLDDDMKWVETKTGFYTNGQHYSMSSTPEFLKFPPLTMIEKLRLGATIFYASKLKDWKRLESVNVTDWLESLSGPGVMKKIWIPLLRAKLGENYKQASASFIWAIIARMYAARRTGLKKEMFGYLSGGGYSRMLAAFAEKLRKEGVELHTGHRLDTVSRNGCGVELQFQGERSQKFDQVVMTVPAPAVSLVAEDLTQREHDLLKSIRYQGIVCASAVLKKPLAGYYVTNITDDWVPYTAVIEMSALVDRKELGGHHLVYLPKYLDSRDSAAFERSDEEIQTEFWAALRRMHPHLEDDDLVSFKVSRARHVLALSTLNYSESLPPLETSIEGLYSVNSALICNGTLNVNETVQLAENAAEELTAEMVQRKERQLA